MKEVLKELFAIEPNLLGGRLNEGETIINLDYTATGVQYELVFKEYGLAEIKLIDGIGGKCVLLGESIKTDRDILNEICFEIHFETMKYKNEIY